MTSPEEECTQQLNLQKLLSVSMDGPNVNWKFLELLQQEQCGGAAIDNLLVITAATEETHNFRRFMRTAREFNYTMKTKFNMTLDHNS
ncbi:procollagen-lysine,2-oxoglutarate 5-dioxygenase 1-like isoform 3-T4 [Pholidichthys leucotaenia]